MSMEPSSSTLGVEASDQERQIWIAEMLSDRRDLYWIEESWVLPEGISIDQFNLALNRLIQRHPNLRAFFREEEGRLFKEFERFQPRDFSKSTPFEGFDICTPPLIAFSFQRESEGTLFVLRAHHIIFDAWSLRLFLKELELFYIDLESSLPRIEITESSRSPQNPKRAPSPLNISQKETKEVSDVASVVGFSLTGEQLNFLEAFCRKEKCTLNHLFLAAFIFSVNQESGDDKIPIAISTANRNHPSLFNVIGMFVETQVLEFAFNSEPLTLIKNVKEACLSLLSNPNSIRNYPPQSIQLFFNYLDSRLLKMSLGNHLIFPKPPEIKTALFDLRLEVRREEGALHTLLAYRETLFDQCVMKSICNYLLQFLNLLEQS